MRWTIPEAGQGYVSEIKSKCYWEIVIRDNQLLLIQRGGPLEPIALEVSVENNLLVVTDDWNWGSG